MAFARQLLSWYDKNARDLPWRLSPTPYRVWVSEIMLQQTQVDTVRPYFARWMETFPTISALAKASEQDVLALWEGLGYYSRARNLHKAAQMVVQQSDGRLPQSVDALKKLPGIGPYTAAAIASIAFSQDVAAVDGNIRRVLARYFDVQAPLGTSKAEKRFWSLAQQALPTGRAGDYNQAMMDLGASICTPRSPACEICPLAEGCLARRQNLQSARPVRRPRKKVPHHTVTAAVIRRGAHFLLAQRHLDGLLGGMWEFPGGTMEDIDADLPACLARELQEELGVSAVVGQSFGVYDHAYTHFKITLHAFICELPDDADPQPLDAADLAWVRPEALADYPMGKVDRQIAKRILEGIIDGGSICAKTAGNGRKSDQTPGN